MHVQILDFVSWKHDKVDGIRRGCHFFALIVDAILRSKALDCTQVTDDR